MLTLICFTNGQTQAPSCDRLVSNLNDRLPRALNQGGTSAVNVLQQEFDRYHMQLRAMPQIDYIEMTSAIQFIYLINKNSSTAFFIRARTAQSTANALIDKQMNEFKMKGITVLLTTNPPDLLKITNQLRADCMSLKTAADGARSQLANALNMLITESLLPLTTPTNYRGQLFALLQPILVSGGYDFFWSRLENYLLGVLISMNDRKSACIRVLATSINNRLNADSNRELTRTADLLAVSNAVETFKPSQTTGDVSMILQQFRNEAQNQIEKIKMMPRGSPEHSAEIITFLATFTQSVSENIARGQGNINTAFNQCVMTLNRIVGPSNSNSFFN